MGDLDNDYLVADVREKYRCVVGSWHLMEEIEDIYRTHASEPVTFVDEIFAGVKKSLFEQKQYLESLMYPTHY